MHVLSLHGLREALDTTNAVEGYSPERGIIFF